MHTHNPTAWCKEIADTYGPPELIEPVVAIARDAHAKGVPIAVASSGVKPTVTVRRCRLTHQLDTSA